MFYMSFCQKKSVGEKLFCERKYISVGDKEKV